MLPKDGPAEWLAVAPARMLNAWLAEQVGEILDRRLARVETVFQDADVAGYQRELREVFIEALGGFPERTPLDARVTGAIQRDGYRIEKILYYSQPGFSVTATLYLPEGPGPHPGVLHGCGHSADGKAAERYQQASALMALHGLDHAGFILMRAPWATLILAAMRDYVPIDGTWEAFRQAKRLYTRLGLPDRDEAFEEPELELLPGEALHAAPGGSVLNVQGPRSFFDLTAAKEAALAEQRQRRWGDPKERESLLAEVRALAGIPELRNLSPAESFIAYMLGRSLMGLRTADLLQTALSWHAELPEDASIHLVGRGHATVPALHAAALERPLFDRVDLSGGPESWAELCRGPALEGRNLENAVHGALRVYDLPNLHRVLRETAERRE